MYFLISLIVPVFSFILQSYPRFFNKYFGVDVWTRLIEINQVKQAKHKIPQQITKGFIIDGYFDYPIVFPWIFSFFSKRKLLKIQGFVSPFFDALQNITVFFITYNLTNNIYAALLAQVIYSCIPIIAIENSYLTPRSLGYFFFTLSFYFLLIFHSTHQITYFLLALLFTTLLFLTHRFALQSLLFISLFFTAYDKSMFYMVNFLLGLFVATVITKGYYLRVAKGHLFNIYFWVKNYKYRFAHQIHGLKLKNKSDWVGKIYFLLSYMSPIFLLGLNGWLLSSIIYIYLTSANALAANPLLHKMAIWVIFFYILASVVLKVKRFIPIGEGQRYLEMATVPSAVLTSVLFFYFYNLYGVATTIMMAALVFGNLILILFVQVKGIIKDKNRSLTENLIKTFEFINTLPEKPRIMCIPHQITTMTVYNTKADVLVNADNPGLMKITDVYPIIKIPIKQLTTKYNLNYLLLRESFAKLKDLKIKNAKVVYASGDIVLVRL
jgi:hypothetical protein